MRWHGRLDSPLIPEILGDRDKGRPGQRLRVFPYFAALKHGRRKDELLLFAGRVGHLKPDQLNHSTTTKEHRGPEAPDVER